MTNGNGKSKFVIKKGTDVASRLTMILWGLPGTGKTTWAATAPGDKLWVSYGDSEHISVMNRKDIDVLDLSAYSVDDVFNHGLSTNPYDLDHYLAEHRNIRTVVCDSLTAVQYLGLKKAVDDKMGKGQNFTPTMQDPGRAAYGGRNQNLLGIMKALLTITAKHRRHLIFTAHESDPITIMNSGKEEVDRISITLGGQLVGQVSAAISEIWNLRQDTIGKNDRIITTRVYGKRRPMKTRMFSQKGPAEFVIVYDPDKPDTAPGQITIASFWEQWQKGGMQKIFVPDNRRGARKEGTILGPTSAV
jgi:hypothetical protein